MEAKWSKYNYIFESEKFGYLLYNTLSNCFVELNTDTYNQLIDFKNQESISNVPEDVPTEFFNELKSSKILVESDYDEYLRVKSNRLANRNNENVVSLTIAPTLHCNFNCPYCFESSRPSVYMTDLVEDKLIDFIKHHDKANAISVTWFGGEPLMAFKRMESITKKILGLNKKFSAGIVTNGFLLDEDKISKLKELNVEFIQITLDGTENMHNQKRPLLNGKGTFQKIIKNIDSLMSRQKELELSLSIRVNIDRANKDGFSDLYYYIKKRYPDNPIQIYPGYIAPVVEGCGSNGDTALDRQEQATFMKEQFLNYGITSFEFFPNQVNSECMARQKNGYLIGPRGEIYKCWMDLGKKDAVVGSLVEKNVSNNKTLNMYLHGLDQFEDSGCQSCMLVPVCNSGCPKYKIDAFQKNAHYDHCHVAKGNLKEFLEIHYTKRMAGIGSSVRSKFVDNI
jgi:uncharacterized protein